MGSNKNACTGLDDVTATMLTKNIVTKDSDIRYEIYIRSASWMSPCLKKKKKTDVKMFVIV